MLGQQKVTLNETCSGIFAIKRVWRYHRGNQNPYIEEKTAQWPREKVQKDKQLSTAHTYKTKDRVTRTPLKGGGELRCSGRVNSFCSTSGTRRVDLFITIVLLYSFSILRFSNVNNKFIDRIVKHNNIFQIL